MAGSVRAPVTFRLVVVALVVEAVVAKKLVEVILVAVRLVGAKVAATKVPPTYKLVDETLLPAVPEAVANVRPPVSVPPVKSR